MKSVLYRFYDFVDCYGLGACYDFADRTLVFKCEVNDRKEEFGEKAKVTLEFQNIKELTISDGVSSDIKYIRGVAISEQNDDGLIVDFDPLEDYDSKEDKELFLLNDNSTFRLICQNVKIVQVSPI